MNRRSRARIFVVDDDARVLGWTCLLLELGGSGHSLRAVDPREGKTSAPLQPRSRFVITKETTEAAIQTVGWARESDGGAYHDAR